MSTFVGCDYPDCGEPATVTVEVTPLVDRIGIGTVPQSVDACEDHVELVRVWKYGRAGWPNAQIPYP